MRDWNIDGKTWSDRRTAFATRNYELLQADFVRSGRDFWKKKSAKKIMAQKLALPLYQSLLDNKLCFGPRLDQSCVMASDVCYSFLRATTKAGSISEALPKICITKSKADLFT